MTFQAAEASTPQENFNSHTREGVTSGGDLLNARISNFNSHTREGVTTMIDGKGKVKLNFNSHTREGVTRSFNDDGTVYIISTHTPVRV